MAPGRPPARHRAGRRAGGGARGPRAVRSVISTGSAELGRGHKPTRTAGARSVVGDADGRCQESNIGAHGQRERNHLALHQRTEAMSRFQEWRSGPSRTRGRCMPPALICLSHRRWDFVYQRPNHLMARAARGRRVYFVEEPVPATDGPGLDMRPVDGLTVVRPMLPDGLAPDRRDEVLSDLMCELVVGERLADPWLWYYTPLALPWTREVNASASIYDCMDELSACRGAPAERVKLESELFERADIVFTGGRSLYEAKARRHPRVHAVPSAVDVAHFASARRDGADPTDQAALARPRVGYYGVIDERLDLGLIRDVARLRPDWQVVLVGPVAKLAPDEIPQASNIHRLGLKSYDELPDYLRGW